MVHYTGVEGRKFAEIDIAGLTVLSDEVLGDGFALVVSGADAGAVDRGAWDRLGARIVTVLPAGSTPREGSMVDETGKVGAWFAARGVRCALVRPDRFIFAAGALADLPGIARAAERTFLSVAPHEANPRHSAVA